MDDKKKIGNFFRDNIQDESFEPNDSVWPKISKTLKKREKRRFFWWAFASISSVLLILYFFIFKVVPDFKNTSSIKNEKSKAFPTSVVKLDSNKRNTIPFKTPKFANDTEGNLTISITELHEQSEKSNNNTTPKTNKKKSDKASKIDAKILNKNNSKPTDSIFEITTKSNKNSKNSITDSIKNNSNYDKTLQNQKFTDTITKKELDSLKSKKKSKRKKQSLIKKEEDKVKKDSLGKWHISVHFSPILSTYLNDRNLLIPQSQLTNKQIALSYSYRMLFTIPIHEKINFRFGAGHQEFKYKSRFSPNSATNSYGGLQLSNIDGPLNQPSQSLTNDINAGNIINLEHYLRYLQIPLELSYKLKEEKIHINLISGFDIFILQDDDILLSSGNTSEFLLGRTNYLSELSLAFHSGIGLEYPISKRIKFQLEPTVIYQFGGYENNVKNPHPIYFSLYTGFYLKF